ncbi:MAG: alkaline phosphatase family protein [Bacteroidia bacterium]|nr:alkaline phosphatase family protein [Bacteroidia bacterium]
MKKTAVVNVVGLTPEILNRSTFLKTWAGKKNVATIKPQIPAVTCTMQACYLTGTLPAQHGIVGNGWYFKTEHEIKFWRQSNDLVQGKKIWHVLKEINPAFTCAYLFWWYNMYADVDFAITPRPQYHADGLKLPDIYTKPDTLRNDLQKQLGTFPLFDFWGPRTTIKSTQWIAQAAIEIFKQHSPTLNMVYLPHLDYNFQRHGNVAQNDTDIIEVDNVCRELITFYESQQVEVIVLSEYGITDVNETIHLNRLFRKNNWLAIRNESGHELLDAGASKVFAVADHQVAHIYLNDKSIFNEVLALLKSNQAIEHVWHGNELLQQGLQHKRCGDMVCVAKPHAWFTYYYWHNDNLAPDFAPTVDIHRKPGYDPAELFINPKIKLPILKAGYTLLKKKLGFRYLMDVIPMHAEMVKGSHGAVPQSKTQWPIVISNTQKKEVLATDVFDIIKQTITG